jgi:hypothetical protein
MFRCEFSTTNAAFDDAPASEAARILREIARKIEAGESFDGVIFDANGNRIGAWSMDDKGDSE